MSSDKNSSTRSLSRQVGRALGAAAVRVPIVGRSAAAARGRGAQRTAEEHGLPPALHARALRHDREGRREPLPLAPAPLQAAAAIASATRRRAPTTSSRRRSRRPAAGGGGAGHRAHLASTTGTARRSRSGTPTCSCARRSIWSSSSRPTSMSRRSSPPSTAKPGIPLIAIEVPHPGATYFGANNYEAGLDRRTPSRPMGETALALRTSTRSCCSRSSARAACRRCG